MNQEDRHNTAKISLYVALVTSAVIFAVGIAGYQRTGDILQLLLFVAMAGVAFAIVKFLFVAVNKILDSLEPKDRE